jgi:hypothetical protein
MTELEVLQQAFDRGFADAPAPATAVADLLVVRVGDAATVLVQSQIAALHAGIRIMAMPSRCRELLGIANVRGAIVPVYDLRLALGHDAGGAPRWLVVATGSRAALAFDAFERHARTPAFAHDQLPPTVEIAGAVYPVVDVAVVLKRIAGRGAAKEL